MLTATFILTMIVVLEGILFLLFDIDR